MKNNNLTILKNPYFIFSLVTLLLNDHLLKPLFDNWITGKLSDFAGLFLFPLFILAFLPKVKKFIFPLTAVLFTLWKSELSEGFIQWWNATPLFSINRVIDYTDLFALSILPLSKYIYNNSSLTLNVKPSIIAMISFVGIFASSKGIYEVPLDHTFTFQKSKAELYSILNNSDSTLIFGENTSTYDSLKLSEDTAYSFLFHVYSLELSCSNELYYRTKIYGDSVHSYIHLIDGEQDDCSKTSQATLTGLKKKNYDDQVIRGEALHYFIERIASKL